MSVHFLILILSSVCMHINLCSLHPPGRDRSSFDVHFKVITNLVKCIMINTRLSCQNDDPLLPLSIIHYAGFNVCYSYLNDLLNLHPKKRGHPTPDSYLSSVHSPIVIPTWQACLSNNPYVDYVSYVLNGLQQGFNIGIDTAAQLHSTTATMLEL